MGWLKLRLNRNFKAPGVPSLGHLQKAGDAARDLRRWEEAVGFYEEIIRLDPSAFDIAIQLGHAYKEMRNYDRAAELYSSVLTFRPNDDDLHLQIGHLEKIRGNHEKALDHYRIAADLNSQNGNARSEYQALKNRFDDMPSMFDQSAASNMEPADRDLKSLDAGPADQMAINIGRHRPSHDIEHEHDKFITIQKSPSTLSGTIARPSWVASQLPSAQNAEDSFFRRVDEIEKFLMASHIG